MVSPVSTIHYSPRITDVTRVYSPSKSHACAHSLRHASQLANLGITSDAQVLDSILAEEKDSYRLLTAIADDVNLEATA